MNRMMEEELRETASGMTCKQGKQGFTPFDYAKENEYLKNTKAYWLLNEAQYR
ncbi:MAG: hypothetical protein V6Z81_04015 [Parvularculales bacterium]